MNGEEMASFDYQGYRIAYTEHGSGDEVTVLLPGLLLPQTMQLPLARQLARRGHRVITMDPLGPRPVGSPARALALLDGGVRAADDRAA